MKSTVLIVFIFMTLFAVPKVQAQTGNGEFKIARVQYQGGGDWYNSPTALRNLIRFTKGVVPIQISEQVDDVQIGSRDIFNYPFLFITGHGNISLNDTEMQNLRSYLENGGFLYVDDDYGLDQYIRPILRNIFPDEPFFELPADHPIYDLVYTFPDGRPPKIHEHDNQPPQAFAVYQGGRMVLLYTYESNPSDGWAFDEHSNPESVVESALQFGVNVLVYALSYP
ncbi:MAG: DUF4159 domain-containing protein [Balneolaceae bacterium]